ncbi:glycosyltransferase family 2 protein [Sporolactobacillus sp. THM7-7]|nr:glycosyltransferase family 2 protein [Sporolactobacillus sp. THM7-7]
MSKRVAIIVLNWNDYDDTAECLKSLEWLNYPDFHVYLVDNHSSDHSFEKLQEENRRHPFQYDITFLESGANLGFAGGNNLAIKKAYNEGYDYFWLVNNDAVVTPDALTELVRTLEKDERAGIAGSKIYYYNSTKIWFAGGLVSLWTGQTHHIGLGEEDRGQYDKEQPVEYITGCSLLFKRALIDKIGLMREFYFLYYEETEWNIRARQAGFKVVYQPNSRVFHKVSTATGGEQNPDPFVAYYDLRNEYWMIKHTQNLLRTCVAYFYRFYKAGQKLKIIFADQQDRKLQRIKYIFKAVATF